MGFLFISTGCEENNAPVPDADVPEIVLEDMWAIRLCFRPMSETWKLKAWMDLNLK